MIIGCIYRHPSSSFDVTCGVPQGSTLGPLLFLLYINDLRFALKFSTASHFADDTYIIYHSKKLKTLESDLNHDLKLCSEWLNANRLSLCKCRQNQTFTFSLKEKENGL